MGKELDEKELERVQTEARSMVRFFKTLWDEIDAQFQSFEKQEKIQVFSSIIQATIAYTGSHEPPSLEEFLREAAETAASRSGRKGKQR